MLTSRAPGRARCPGPGRARSNHARLPKAVRAPPDVSPAATDPTGPGRGAAVGAPPGGARPSHPPGGQPRNRPWPVEAAPRCRQERHRGRHRRPVRPGSARRGWTGEPAGRGEPPERSPRGASDAWPPVARSGCSGRERRATLAATRREDRTTGAGVHAQPETVGLRAAAVVRLEGTLAHGRAPSGCLSGVYVRSSVRRTGRARASRDPPSMDTDLFTVRTGSAQVKRALSSSGLTASPRRGQATAPESRPHRAWCCAAFRGGSFTPPAQTHAGGATKPPTPT